MGLKIPSPPSSLAFPVFFSFPSRKNRRALLFPSPPPWSFCSSLFSPRVRILWWKFETLYHGFAGNGGPSLLLTSERSILIRRISFAILLAYWFFPSCGVFVCVLQRKSLGFGTACEAGQAAAAVQAHHELVARALCRRAAWQRRRRRRSRASAAEPPRD